MSHQMRTARKHVDGSRSFSAAFILLVPLLTGALLKVCW